MWPERVRNRVRKGRSGPLFAGFVPSGQACRWRIEDCQPISQCRALSTTGPSKGIADIHLPMRERPDSLGAAVSTLAGGTAAGVGPGRPRVFMLLLAVV